MGALHASEPRRTSEQVADIRGSCSSTLDGVAVDLDVTLDESAEPWADALRWQTLVDGERFAVPHARNERARDASRVFVACVEPEAGQHAPDLAEGTHRAQRRASLPGAETPLATEEIEIELRCDEPEPEPGGSGCAVAPGGRGAVGGGALVALAALARARRRRRARADQSPSR